MLKRVISGLGLMIVVIAVVFIALGNSGDLGPQEAQAEDPCFCKKCDWHYCGGLTLECCPQTCGPPCLYDPNSENVCRPSDCQ